MQKKTLEQLLDAARQEIAVTGEELSEARRRRQLLANAALGAFPDSTTYFNGSIAHGDANTPLTDVDLGVKLSTEESAGFGPGEADALPLMERAREAIRADLSDEFENLTVTVEGRRRAVLVRFGDPVTAGQTDFTADVITALPHPSGTGLYIPNMEISDKWDHADPIRHIELVREANSRSRHTFARAVRLLKHWNSTHKKPLCSWNIKALALESITTSMPLIHALESFFIHAVTALTAGPTPDPAGVAGPIPLNLDQEEVLSRLRTARDHVALALEHEKAGRLLSAQHALSMVLKEIVPDVDETEEEASRLRTASLSVGTSASGLGLLGPQVPSTRAWAP